MKPFVFSSILNVLLGAALAFALLHRDRPVPDGDQPLASQPAGSHSGEPDQRATRAAALHWSDLESDDYPTYIRNLRSIGCPEQTVRDIITADIKALYDTKLQALRKQGLTASQLAVAEETLKSEQAALVESLFAPPRVAGSSAVSAGAGSDAAGTPDVPATLTTPAAVPLVLLDPDPSLQLDQNQTKIWQRLQDKFVAAVGGEWQNPNDPGYRERWEKAQKEMDDALQAYLGDDVFNEMMRKRQHSKPGATVSTQ
jgi:hypothetical protein